MKRPEMALNKMAELLEADAVEARAQLATLGVEGPKFWGLLAGYSRFAREVAYTPENFLDSGGVRGLERGDRAIIVDWPFASFIEINAQSGYSLDKSFRYFRRNGTPQRVISFAIDWIDGIFLSSISDHGLLEKVSRAAASRFTRRETRLYKKMKTVSDYFLPLQFGRGYTRSHDLPIVKTELRWSPSGTVEISSSFTMDSEGNGTYHRAFNFINKSSVKIDGKQLQLPF